LTLKTESRAEDALGSAVQISIPADDSRIFASHFQDRRPRERASSKIAENLHPYVVGAGEGDSIHLRAVHQCLA